RAIASGNGFYLPPLLSPLPPLRYWQAADRAALAASEARLLAHLPAALRACGGRAAGSVVEALLGDDQFVQSFAEFDHVYERPGADYLGAWPSAEFGVAPSWPPGAGPRLFGYLDPTVLLPELLAAVDSLGARLCAYAPGVAPAAMAAAPTVVWMHEPVDLMQAAAQADAYVSNANINSMMAFLLAGKPQLVLPYTLEKYLVGRRLEMLGAGLSAPRRAPGDLAAKLRAVLHGRDCRRAAERFAARYAGLGEDTAAARMQARLGLDSSSKIDGFAIL
ncbi:MAG: glycosyltransferase, partial [Gammaproteobacteria bacterium]